MIPAFTLSLHSLLVVLFGLAIAGMIAIFYAAIARIPLGIAVTLEFVDPLGVAVAVTCCGSGLQQVE
jgi:threonine/homoserine efflux transporter RhtA